MEEFNERAQSDGLPAARRWYWRAILRNMIALAARGEIADKALRRTLFRISGIWFALALLLMWLSHAWLMGLEHQAWGMVTLLVFLLCFLLMTGWLVPLLWALIPLLSPSLVQAKHGR
jgi:MFS family permease